MTIPPGTYPVTIFPKRAIKKQNRLRFSWFLLGTVFGIASAAGFHALMPTASVAEAPAAEVQPEGKPLSKATASPPATAVSKQAKALTPVVPPVLVDPKPVPQTAYTLTVENGDTLIAMLTDTGISMDEAQLAVDALRKVVNPRAINAGQNIAVDMDPHSVQKGEPRLSKLSMPISKTSHVELERKSSGGFSVKKIDAPTEKALIRGFGVITSSFYETGIKAGMPANMLEEVIKAYSYDIDFQRDIHDGDTLEAMYEKIRTDKGDTVGFGSLVYASLKTKKGTLTIYRYADGSGSAEFYNEKGETIRKALLKTPVNGARISSGFGMRNHPILGYSKMHKGIDFAAPTGTPIYAAGDGVVDFAGTKGGYGNYLMIKHNKTHATAYAHLSRFGSGVRPGTKVKQGQVVAYVGSTGASTGPHLHYEILVNGSHVNPSGVKFKTGGTLSGKQLAAFKQHIGKTRGQLAALSSGEKKYIALSDAAPASAMSAPAAAKPQKTAKN